MIEYSSNPGPMGQKDKKSNDQVLSRLLFLRRCHKFFCHRRVFLRKGPRSDAIKQQKKTFAKYPDEQKNEKKLLRENKAIIQ